jgi:hypothetical protein
MMTTNSEVTIRKIWSRRFLTIVQDLACASYWKGTEVTIGNEDLFGCRARLPNRGEV